MGEKIEKKIFVRMNRLYGSYLLSECKIRGILRIAMWHLELNSYFIYVSNYEARL